MTVYEKASHTLEKTPDVMSVIGEKQIQEIIDRWSTVCNSSDEDAISDFENFFGGVVFLAAQQLHPNEVRDNIVMVRSRDKAKQQEGKESQNQLLFKVKNQIISLTGIDYMDNEIERQMAKNNVKEIILQSGAAGSHEALTTLGILSKDQDGNDRFTYPRDLMPSSTNKKWDEYVAAVKTHLSSQAGVSQGRLTPDDLKADDMSRRIAHNTIATELMDVLQLPNDDSEGAWSFETTRRLVTKMREARFPDRSTGEADRTQEAIWAFNDNRQSRELGVGAAVVTQVGIIYDPEASQAR